MPIRRNPSSRSLASRRAATTRATMPGTLRHATRSKTATTGSAA
jgi:hypothetical protein